MAGSRRARVLAAVVAALVVAMFVVLHPRTQFELGGALVNVGVRLQDRLEPYDFEHGPDIRPEQIWSELVRQNEEASSVRRRFPRTTEHPVVAMLVCMDARIDTSELAGDTRRYYYVVRTAGSILDVEEQEMLELAVQNGVKVIVLTRHTDCAAEKVAADPRRSEAYPALTSALAERERHVAAFLARPLIAERIRSGDLLVKQALIDTRSSRIVLDDGPAAVTPPRDDEGARAGSAPVRAPGARRGRGPS